GAWDVETPDGKGGVAVEPVPLRNAMNAVMRGAYIRDCEIGVKRWNRLIQKAGFALELRLPSPRFRPSTGPWAGPFADPPGPPAPPPGSPPAPTAPSAAASCTAAPSPAGWPAGSPRPTAASTTCPSPTSTSGCSRTAVTTICRGGAFPRAFPARVAAESEAG